jgi:hypothetical protein
VVRSIPEAKKFLERGTVDIVICDYDAREGSSAGLVAASKPAEVMPVIAGTRQPGLKFSGCWRLACTNR